MPDRIQRVAFVIAAALIALVSSARISIAGPIVLAGHDAEDHGGHTIYAAIFDEILANVTNGNSGILVIGADPGTEATSWIEVVVSRMTSPQTITVINNAQIDSQSFSSFAIIHVASTDEDISGGMTATEQASLNARAIDIANFINGGGGLFGLTRSEGAEGFGYLGAFAEIVSMPLPSSGICAGSETFDDITATAQGSALGIGNGLDGCCWHNVFTGFAGFFNVLATANEPNCPDIDGEAAIIGCFACSIAGQMSLAPPAGIVTPGTTQNLTATLVEPTAPNDPIPGVLVSFEVIAGPNVGETGTDTTDIAGQAEFSYVSNGTRGIDQIRATAVEPISGETVLSNIAFTYWDTDCQPNSIPDACDIDCAGFGGQCITFGGCGQSADVDSDDEPDECGPYCGDGNLDLAEGETCDEGGATPTCDSDCTLVSCGDGTINAPAGEECDPPATGICNGSCIIETVCGDGIVGPDEECDDSNFDPGDGCDANCELEAKFCLNGIEPSTARKAKLVAFTSLADYVGLNADGNQEIFTFDKKTFDKLIRNGADESSALAQTIFQITDTVAPVVNSKPGVNGSGRFVTWVSSGNFTGGNADQSTEIFLADMRQVVKGLPPIFTQVTDSTDAANTNPNLRMFKGDILLFQSPKNLVPDLCSGGTNYAMACTSDLDCPGGTCGNRESNTEIYQWARRRPDFGVILKQLTTAPFGDATIGRSQNFSTDQTAFASTADYLGTNPDNNSEIYRVGKLPDTLIQITNVPAGQGDSSEPAQARKRRIALVSTADLDPLHPNGNADGNKEVFLYSEDPPAGFVQISDTTGCTNGAPSIDSKGRFLAFHSDCNITGPNPGQSIFIYDTKRSGLLPFMIRGPFDTDSAEPLMTKKAKVIGFSGNLSSVLLQAICFFNTEKGQLEGPALPN